MKYYRHPTTGEVYAYEADGSQDAFILPDLMQMTDEEIQAHLAPPTVSLTEQFEQVRAALQGAIDAKAREFGFSGGNALILYAGFANSFQTLAKQFAGWEVIVWVEAGQYKQQVLEGSSPMLTPAQAVAMMPGYPA